MSPSEQDERAEDHLEENLEVAFAPLHKRNLGIAAGVVLGSSVFLVTLWHRLRSPDNAYPLNLLDRFFLGYGVSLGGAFIGALWGLWVGFVVGWFFAFSRNAVLSVARLFFNVRAELSASRGFLDDL